MRSDHPGWGRRLARIVGGVGLSAFVGGPIVIAGLYVEYSVWRSGDGIFMFAEALSGLVVILLGLLVAGIGGEITGRGIDPERGRREGR